MSTLPLDPLCHPLSIDEIFFTFIFSQQLPAPPSFPDNSSLAHIDQALIKYPKILLSVAERTSSSERQIISDKNSSILEGVAFWAVALFATWIGLIKSSERHEVLQRRSVHTKQQKKETDNNEWHHALRLFSKASQMVGSTAVAVAYMAILWVGEESTSQINCGAQEVQDALDAFPLLETPGDIVSVTGDCIPLVSEAICLLNFHVGPEDVSNQKSTFSHDLMNPTMWFSRP